MSGKTAVCNTFHSQSLDHLGGKTIISLDSHLDNRVILREYVEVLEDNLTGDLVSAFERAYVHFLLSRRNETWVVIPKSGFSREVSSRNLILPVEVESKDVFRGVDLMNEYLGTDLHLFRSPPKELGGVLEKVDGEVVIDVDVDYMDEFQDDCFTPEIFESKSYSLCPLCNKRFANKRAVEKHMSQEHPDDVGKNGSMGEVLGLIDASDADLVTISEVKSYESPPTREFMEGLEALGYEITRGQVLHESEAEALIEAHFDYERSAMGLSPSERADILRDWVKRAPPKYRS